MVNTPPRPRVTMPRHYVPSSLDSAFGVLVQYNGSSSSGSDMEVDSPIVQMLQRRVTADVGNAIQLTVRRPTSLRIPQRRKRSYTRTLTKRKRKNARYSDRYAMLQWIAFPKRK